MLHLTASRYPFVPTTMEAIMNIIAINGSPRKHANTATLLEQALQGAAAALPKGHVQTRLIHLYDLHYTGCRSCFACKRLGGAGYGRCNVHDDLLPLLVDISEADALILGSPIYFGSISGQMRSFLERLLFPWLVYDNMGSSLAPRRMPTAFVYTMNLTEARMKERGYPQELSAMETYIERILTRPRTLYITDTLQFDDYSAYMCTCFDSAAKHAHHTEQFPKDCQAAWELGAALAQQPV